MKKRIFGILLMGAMVVASMSMFTSCKDYDDDIQANKDDITALKTQLATLQTAAATAQSAADAAKSAADAAATAAKNAQTSADAAGTAAKNAQTSADAAAATAAANATAIKAAQDAVKALEEQVAAFAKVEELNAVKADLEKAIADATAGKVSAEELTEALKPISAKIDAIDESLNTLTADVKALKEWKATIEGQIASLMTDLKSQADLIKTLQGEIKNKLDKGDLSGLANEDAIKAYVDNLLKTYAQSSEVSAAIANALKTYTTTADLKKMLDGYSTPAAVQTAITNALQGYYTVAKTDDMVKVLTDAVNAAQATASAATTSAQAAAIAQGIADNVSKEAGDKINNLNVFVKKRLTSIVLRPEFYEGGIEGVEVMNLNDTIFALQNAANKGKVTELWGIKGAKAVSQGNNFAAATNAMVNFLPDANTVGNMAVYNFNPDTKAYYHVNPITADLIGQNVKFYTNIAMTRQGYDNLATPAYTEISQEVVDKYYSNGILEVPFSVNRNTLNGIVLDPRTGAPTGNQAFISLSLEKNDTLVTSDYAILSPADYIITALAGTWLTTPANPHKTADDHLWYNIVANGAGASIDKGILYNEGGNYYSPITAFTDAYKLPVVYNESIDLAKYVKTHYKYQQYWSSVWAGGWSQEMTMTPALMEKLGLHYEFEAIHYLSGSNRTDEYEHIQLNGSVASPRSVTNAGKQIPDQVATREVIGREPLVRVTLVNEAGDVLQVGYILLQITSTAPSTNTVTVDFPSTYYMNCTANADLTWSQVEADILRAVGMSKAEFEASYELEVEPAQNIDIDYNNATSVTTTTNVKTARQYYWTGAKWAKISDYNAAINASTATAYNTAAKKRAAYKWPLGSVYEVVNTGAQQTTVLRWTVGSSVVADIAKTTAVGFGTTDQPMIGAWGSIDRALAASGASVANQGVSTNPVSVTVAYKMKDNTGAYIDANAIYVTLNIPASKLHFAYAKVAGKDLSLWYKNNSYQNSANSDESDAAEIHLNVPTPALLAGPLADIQFNKALTETFVSNRIGLTGLDSHFNKFANINWGFKLVAPTAANSTNIVAAKQKLTGASNTSSTEYPNSWVVNGVTGAQYLLQVQNVGTLGDTKIAIVAWKNPKTRRAVDLAADVVNLTLAGQIDYANNKYAQDILNYSGRLNQAATDLQTSSTEYLGVEDKTFTAFIQIVQNGNFCYNLLMPNEYFKARWLRPINVYNKGGMWTDALNTRQELVVAEIVGIKDWRNMEVNGSLTGAANVNAPFYGIADSTFQHFYVDETNIYTDHHKAVGDRAAIAPTNIAAIEALKKTSEIPALANPAYFGVTNPTGALTATDRKKAKLYYVNTEANVGTFHLYVPVYVAYSFGEWSYDDVMKGGFVPNAAAEAPLFTQKVYAVIEVKQTTNSQTQARKK